MGLVKEIWLVARELGGWAEAGGVKDVVLDQAQAFARIGWSVHVVLPLYGFLKGRAEAEGRQVWAGRSRHAVFDVPLEVWQVPQAGFDLHLIQTPSALSRHAVYAYTADDERRDPRQVRGQGFSDAGFFNLKFQWGLASYWAAQDRPPGLVLGHDGHVGFLAPICRASGRFGDFFQATAFRLLIHNAGSGYRQELEVSAANDEVLGLPPAVRRAVLLDQCYEPLVASALYGRLATVSENYAQELLTGRNDHWSGPFGRWLRATRTGLTGITNGLSTRDKDPRDPVAAGLPAGFDPLRGDWRGKEQCRQKLHDVLPTVRADTYGSLDRRGGPFYVMQGRLTAQKGVDALLDLVARAVREAPEASFLIMAQGERAAEERVIRLAQHQAGTGRLLFVNGYEEGLARLVVAAGDFFLMPSEYEPCGLSDLKAQLVGTLPIVHRVGGLVKVRDGQTGFSYEKHRGGGFWGAFLRSLHLIKNQPEAFNRLRRQAFLSVLEDFQWERILEERYLPWLTDGGGSPYREATSANLA